MGIQPYATGAVAVFASTNGFEPELLGFAEEYPRMIVETKYGRVMCDLTGSEIPFDFSFQGCVATVSVKLTAWDNHVATSLESRPDASTGFANIPGIWSQSDMGSLIGTETQATIIWLKYFFANAPGSKAIYTGGGLVPGYRFPQTIFQPWENETGTKAMKRQFVFFAWPEGPITEGSIYVPTGWNQQPNPTTANPIYRLYDYDMAKVQNTELSMPAG